MCYISSPVSRINGANYIRCCAADDFARSIRYGFWILEDDAYGELRYGDTSISALKAMDGADKVVYLGSFSQVLFPAYA